MKLQIVSHDEADEIVPQGDDLTAVVSIYSPPNSRMATWVNTHGKVRTRPVLGFDEFPGHKIALSFDDANVEGHNVFVPEEHDIRRFLTWAETVPFPAEGTLLIHCHAGIARSTACALAFLALKHGPGAEEKCVLDVARARPETWFNDLIVHLADGILGRNGALLNAMQEWKDRVKAAGIYGG